MGKYIDITGMKFGKLLVLNEHSRDKHGNVTWLCRCDCGNTKIVSGNCLRKGITTNCGCSKKQAQIIDITGKRYGRLTVKRLIGKTSYRDTLWECECDCGNKVVVKKGNLLSGNTKSCGCLREENITKHGGCNSRLYRVWQAMKHRCLNPKDAEYHNYGGRGITVCNEWLDFKNFYDWSILNGFNEYASKGESTIDRINVNDGYKPENCRWVDMKTQSNNRRNNRFLTYDGKTMTLSQWAEEKNINVGTLQSRIDVHHWSIEKALTTPVKSTKRRNIHEFEDREDDSG